MGGNSGGGGQGGRGGGGAANQANAHEARLQQVANSKELLTDNKFDQKAVTSAIKEDKISRDDLAQHIDHTKYEINQTIKQIDSKLANRGSMKASDLRATKEFQSLVDKRDAMKSNLGKMYDVMKETRSK